MASADDPERIELFVADPRAVIPLDAFRVPRSVARSLRRSAFDIRLNGDFDAVVRACARHEGDGVWLTEPLVGAYRDLHALGHAVSVESWHDGELVGGLFGVNIGRLYTAESMFHRIDDAGNACLAACGPLLAAHGVTLWDIQVCSDHTRRFGAIEVSASRYRALLAEALADGVAPRLR